MEFKPDDSELVPFSNAASRVYTEVTGRQLSLLGGPVVNALLHDVAHAIASLVTIYGASTDKGRLKPLAAPQLKHGSFQRGATVVRTSEGIEYGRLYIRRGDVRSAVTVLKHAGARFPCVEEVPAAVEKRPTGHDVSGDRQPLLV